VEREVGVIAVAAEQGLWAAVLFIIVGVLVLLFDIATIGVVFQTGVTFRIAMWTGVILSVSLPLGVTCIV
jgi:hypothetical protein